MALTSTSTKNLLNEYHRLAADTLLGNRHSRLDQALLSAAEDGKYDRLQSLLTDPNASLDARCPATGDTPLIAAARNGHERVVELLIMMGADVTLQNDMEETVLEVASKKLKKNILNSIHHEGRVMSNAQALLQNAWLGDAVSVKKHLSGNHYLDVNCNNNDGMTPLLLVTRDIAVFDSIQAAMEKEYNPVDVVQDLLDNHADISQCDPKGRNALHFVATSESVHAKKMVSLLMRQGSQVDTLDSQMNSPLHIASGRGHTAIIIALVEEGGADVNSKGGERNDTPLMLTARAGHSEAARYLLAKGADVTAVDDNGDSALSLAATNSMVSLLKEAWVEQTKSKSEGHLTSNDSVEALCQIADSANSQSVTSLNGKTSDLSPSLPSNRSFFLTDQQLSQSPEAALDDVFVGQQAEESTTEEEMSPRPLRASETSTEADDELDGGDVITRRPIRAARDEVKRYSAEVPSSSTDKPTVEASTGKKSRSLPRNLSAALSRVAGEEVKGQAREKKGRVKEDKKSKAKKSNKPRPLQLPISLSQDHILTKSHDRLMGGAKPRDKHSQFLPTVRSNQLAATPPHSPRTHTSTAHNVPNDKLPLLNNMRAVAMVAVDTEQEKLKVHNFGETKTKRPSAAKAPMIRSQSVGHPMKSTELKLGGLRRNSDSIHPTRKSDPNPPSKATLLPNVITPQLGLISGLPDNSRVGGATYAQFLQRGRGRLQPFSKATTSPVQAIHKSLSVVSEKSIEQTRSYPSLYDDQGSKDSTLKASSTSDIETDSLERNIVQVQDQTISPSPLEGQVFNLFPPTPGTAHHQSNLVINYAVHQEGATPLSPIWNRMQQLHSDTDTSSNSEYITSYIGCTTPVPRHGGCHGVKRVGADSGQGESSDEDDSEDSGESDSGEACESGEVKESLRWKRGRLLGKGAYGKVWEGLLDSAKLIAVKEVELDFDNLEKARSQYEKIQMEVEILRSLRHRNIVSYLGTSLQEGLVFIFMDYISGGSLQSILKRFGPLDFRTIVHYTRQIARALVYLHSNGIIHRDIKGANVMVTSKGVVKLIDFGCAKRYCQEGGATGMHSVRGTPYWMSPEVICGHGYGRKSDIWSLGCTVHEMAIAKPPWAEYPPESALFQIGIGKSLPRLPDHLSPVLVNFIHRCLTRDQTERPSAEGLLEDQFLICPDRRGSGNV